MHEAKVADGRRYVLCPHFNQSMQPLNYPSVDARCHVLTTTLWSMRPMINERLGRGQVRERMAVAGGAPGEAGRVQRLPHLEPPRSVRGRLPLTGPADDGPNTPAVEVTTSCFIPVVIQAEQHDELKRAWYRSAASSVFSGLCIHGRDYGCFHDN